MPDRGRQAIDATKAKELITITFAGKGDYCFQSRALELAKGPMMLFS